MNPWKISRKKTQRYFDTNPWSILGNPLIFFFLEEFLKEPKKSLDVYLNQSMQDLSEKPLEKFWKEFFEDSVQAIIEEFSKESPQQFREKSMEDLS